MQFYIQGIFLIVFFFKEVVFVKKCIFQNFGIKIVSDIKKNNLGKFSKTLLPSQ